MRLNPQLRSFAEPALLRASALAGILVSACAIGIAWQLSRILYGVFLGGWSVREMPFHLALLLGFAALRSVLGSLQGYWSGLLAAQAKSQIRSQLLASPICDRQTQFVRGVDALDAWYTQYLPQIFIAMGAPLLIFAVACYIDPWSSLIFLITAPLLPLFLALIGMTAKRKQETQWKLLAKQGQFYLETLLGLKTLRQFGISLAWGNRLAQSAAVLRTATLEVLRLAFLSAFVLEMVGTIGTALIAVELGLRLLHGAIGYQQSLFILLLAPEFYLPLRQLGLRTHAAMEGEAAAAVLFPQSTDNVARNIQVHAIPDSISYPCHNLTCKISSPDTLSTISIRNIQARWPSQTQPVLQNLSLNILPGEHVALVGTSGCGKSSLFACILGILPLEAGTIERKAEICVAWVAQQPRLFQRSLRDNILLTPHATALRDPELWSALERVGLSEFVRNLPQGLDTLAGENGTRLSGGQSRRLALARGLVQKADLLLLDEPDAHMDETSLAAFEDVVMSLEAACLIITHRPQTLERVHRVVRMQAGRIL